MFPSFDLGEMAETLADTFIRNQYIKYKAGQAAPQQFVEPAVRAGVDYLFGDEVDDATGTARLICRPKRRARRKRLLTDRDYMDLASLKTLTGNNEAFKAAVIKAVRR